MLISNWILSLVNAAATGYMKMSTNQDGCIGEFDTEYSSSLDFQAHFRYIKEFRCYAIISRTNESMEDGKNQKWLIICISIHHSLKISNMTYREKSDY